MLKVRDIFLACLAVTGVASARTVALWPLEATETGAFDGRCVIDSRNDLSVRNFTLVDSDLVWDPKKFLWGLPKGTLVIMR